MKNPSKRDLRPSRKITILNFDANDSFYFKLTNINNTLKQIAKKSEIKFNQNDINSLNDELICINNLINRNDDELEKINSIPEFYNGLKNSIQLKKQKSEKAIKIEKIINNYSGSKRLTLKMISLLYLEEYSAKIDKMTVSRILKKELDLHYRKTIIKTPKLMEDNYKLMTYLFLKGVSRCLMLGLELVFIDETGFSLNNANLKVWRNSTKQIYGGCRGNGKEKINLILAINKKEIILGHRYKNETITSEEFLGFLEDLKDTLGEQLIKKSVFILDNASYHTGEEIKKFAIENKLKFLFTVPYKSEYIAIEYVFNLMKNHTYNTINKNIKELAKQIDGLIDDKKINDDIKKIYRLTLEKYLDFEKINEKNNEVGILIDRIYLKKKRKRK